eukprot:gene4679-851_t
MFLPNRALFGQGEWHDKAKVDNCMACDSKFSMTKTKYHCGACGRITCSRCTPSKAKYAPRGSTKSAVPLNRGYMRRQLPAQSVTVCADCHDQIQRKGKVFDEIKPPKTEGSSLGRLVSSPFGKKKKRKDADKEGGEVDADGAESDGSSGSDSRSRSGSGASSRGGDSGGEDGSGSGSGSGSEGEVEGDSGDDDTKPDEEAKKKGFFSIAQAKCPHDGSMPHLRHRSKFGRKKSGSASPARKRSNAADQDAADNEADPADGTDEGDNKKPGVLGKIWGGMISNITEYPYLFYDCP